MSFSIGNIFGGVTNGISKGLTYDAQFISSFIWAVEHAVHDKAPLDALIVIAKKNVSEVVDEAGNLLPNIIGSIIAGGDPFAGSRHDFQAWQKLYGKH